ncbi:hypothetical protein P692DRAFT_20343546 [Suillus brevipes Sb2]|nr:hypothetical protein P692DRAFT_20343546 [Suillus brevipes Sb2]
MGHPFVFSLSLAYATHDHSMSLCGVFCVISPHFVRAVDIHSSLSLERPCQVPVFHQICQQANSRLPEANSRGVHCGRSIRSTTNTTRRKSP